jgi:hypothetical protein
VGRGSLLYRVGAAKVGGGARSSSTTNVDVEATIDCLFGEETGRFR